MALHDHRTPQPSRRSVLGAAAWSVPAIALATAAPAYANSDNEIAPPPVPAPPLPAALGLAASGTWVAWNRMRATVTVANTGGSPAESTVVTVVLPNPYMWLRVFGGNVVPTVTDVSAGWTVSAISVTGSGSGREGVFSLSANVSLPAGTSREVSFDVRLDNRLAGWFTNSIAVSAIAQGTARASSSFQPRLY